VIRAAGVHLRLDRDGVGALCEAPNDRVAPPATRTVWVPVMLVLVHPPMRTNAGAHSKSCTLFSSICTSVVLVSCREADIGLTRQAKPFQLSRTKGRLAHQTTTMNMDSVAYSLPSELLRR